jgi:hypothetical protein
MNVLDAAKDLQAAADEVLELRRRYTAAVGHAETCLRVAATMREQAPLAKRKWYDTQINSLGIVLGLMK